MKFTIPFMALMLFTSPAWAGEVVSADASAKQAPPSTLFMSLQEVEKMQAREKAEEAQTQSSRQGGLPPAPPPLPERKAGWPEKLVSGIVKGAAHQESLNNPISDQLPKPEPVNKNAFSK
ncbi:MAG: hypothetical protein G3M70_05345 [Candidatus Nitronauta litoralis]|uniref:Uncharacterized protein n=1 Tax=Candidatus Nitronauta litoralis TaxID=2705533 RepID=A0A7T0BUN3_9BACT|nr:MAG: hypothetical protein G3M70_05345 [Candidatus Nitronauta litoralis]